MNDNGKTAVALFAGVCITLALLICFDLFPGLQKTVTGSNRDLLLTLVGTLGGGFIAFLGQALEFARQERNREKEKAEKEASLALALWQVVSGNSNSMETVRTDIRSAFDEAERNGLSHEQISLAIPPLTAVPKLGQITGDMRLLLFSRSETTLCNRLVKWESELADQVDYLRKTRELVHAYHQLRDTTAQKDPVAKANREVEATGCLAIASKQYLRLLGELELNCAANEELVSDIEIFAQSAGNTGLEIELAAN